MERENFDTEFFIDEVEKRRAIWDIECSDYSNRNIKRKGWEELVDIFSDSGDSDERRKALGVFLQKKWKGLRDCFVRELKKNKNVSGSGASVRNTYIYFQRLMFLKKSLRIKITDSSIEQLPAEKEQDCSLVDDDVTRPPINDPPKKKKKISAAYTEFLGIIEKNMATRTQQQASYTTEHDDDKLFCLSLHKELLKVNETNRLQTKIDIMHILQKAQQGPHNMLAPTSWNCCSNQNVMFSSPSFSMRPGYCMNNTRMSMREHTDFLQNHPKAPSPASTADSHDSECLELFQ